MVFGEGTMVLGGGCECHGGPHDRSSDDNVKTRTVKKFCANRGSHFGIPNGVCNREMTTECCISFEKFLLGLSSYLSQNWTKIAR